MELNRRRKEAIQLEEKRLEGIKGLEDYPTLHERHRIFPAVFENRRHKRIIDVAAGMGVVGKRIKDLYPTELMCNDISPTCLKCLQNLGIRTTSFDIDDDQNPFPFPDGDFDGIIALAIIEHLIHIDHFLREIHRILCNDVYLYISAPNYSGLPYLLPFLLSGKTFHDPISETSRYEFYAHLRYFTYTTLLEFVGSFEFTPEAVYLALPEGSSRYQDLKSKSKLKALSFRNLMKLLYKLFSPRWAAEPVICFRKGLSTPNRTLRKVML